MCVYISVQFSPVAQSCLTLWDLMRYTTPGFPLHHQLLAPTQNSCPSHQWRHPTSSSSVIPILLHLQSFPASRSFPRSQFFTLGGQSIGVSASASVLPINIQDWFPLGLTGFISLQSRDFQESSPTPQFKSISPHVSQKDLAWIPESWLCSLLCIPLLRNIFSNTHRPLVCALPQNKIGNKSYLLSYLEKGLQHYVKGIWHKVGIWSLLGMRLWWLRSSRIFLQCRRPGFSPWVGKIPWRRKWLSTLKILSWRIPWTEDPGGYSPWCCQSWTSLSH